jgi:hypothetical protein
MSSVSWARYAAMMLTPRTCPPSVSDGLGDAPGSGLLRERNSYDADAERAPDAERLV